MTSTSPQNATVSGDAHANEVNDPDEVDISTLPQPLNTKDNNEVDGRTSNDVVSRKAKDIRKQVIHVNPVLMTMMMIVISVIQKSVTN